MNLPKIDLSEAVLTLLARGEPLSSVQLAAATGRGQSSISLALTKLGDRVQRLGNARTTRYALKQGILGLPAQHPIFWRSSKLGSYPIEWGQITYLQGDWLHIRNEHREWLTRGRLPWFLLPICPQGFLGRALARANPSFPADPQQWTIAQILYTAITQVHDPIGAFSISSTQPLSVPFDAPSGLKTEATGFRYDTLAQQTSVGLPVGSSAAGEQPKFLQSDVALGYYIVKFSPPRGTPFGERWHALLLLEELALKVLQSHGLECAASEVIQTSKRSYLQSTRFDRGAQGSKLHIVALGAIHEEFVGDSWQNWVQTSQVLLQKSLITKQAFEQIARLFAFGHYIGNTDMHSGNLSFFVDDVNEPVLRLAPVYDMLPMMWRPDIHQGELSVSPVRQQFMSAGFEQAQNDARQWAIEFWIQAQALDIDAELKAAASASVERLKGNFSS